MSTEKKSVLIQLVISAAIAVALYCWLWFFGETMSDYMIRFCFVVYLIVTVYVVGKTWDFLFLKREPKILADYDASHRNPPAAIPPTRIAAIVNRQRRNMA